MTILLECAIREVSADRPIVMQKSDTIHISKFTLLILTPVEMVFKTHISA